ncbi:DUF6887 family protein [Aliterella atlantica]|uniref:Uncharacterized protein n=1 Tax=Aliterella atlantica CENA595 TaxID=1618023 RepID=A0A0D8ZYM2_9CYAN|nr:hypothetical protein [Aliterella atlantica]KJH72301.1 hypothetical protein UH38_07715 [Aliterella atlantica CENA595]
MHEFETMSMAELKSYVISHRDDDAAWAKYIALLVASEQKLYPAPIDQKGVEIMEQAFRERLGLPQEGES